MAVMPAYPPVHDRPVPTFSFDRLEMLWQKYPQFHEMTTFTTLEALLTEHDSYQKEWEEAGEEIQQQYNAKHYSDFLVQLSRTDLPFRYAAKEQIEEAWKAQSPNLKALPKADSRYSDFLLPNPYVEAFMAQFAGLDTDRKACFLFPESFASQFFVITEVCRNAELFYPVHSLLPDEETVHYLAVFDKKNMDDVLLMYHLIYTDDLYGGYSLYDYPLPWYQNHLRADGKVLRSPFLPDRLAKYQGSMPYYHNPVKTVMVRQNIEHILQCGYFRDELDLFLQLTCVIMPFFQWWWTDLTMYEEKDGLRTDWRLRRTQIRTQLTAQGVIRPKWKHELTLFQTLHERYPDTLYQYRPDWLGNQSLDLYIPSLRTAVEYQGVQHYRPVVFFGGEEALAQRQLLDRQKKERCEENGVRLIEWPYSVDPTDKNLESMLI